MVKGSSVTFVFTFYSVWTGSASTSVLANLTGATVKLIIKRRPKDADSKILVTVAGIVDANPLNGIGRANVNSADTDTLTESKVWYEGIAKLASGSVIRSGARLLELEQKVLTTMF